MMKNLLYVVNKTGQRWEQDAKLQLTTKSQVLTLEPWVKTLESHFKSLVSTSNSQVESLVNTAESQVKLIQASLESSP